MENQKDKCKKMTSEIPAKRRLTDDKIISGKTVQHKEIWMTYNGLYTELDEFTEYSTPRSPIQLLGMQHVRHKQLAKLK